MFVFCAKLRGLKARPGFECAPKRRAVAKTYFFGYLANRKASVLEKILRLLTLKIIDEALIARLLFLKFSVQCAFRHAELFCGFINARECWKPPLKERL